MRKKEKATAAANPLPTEAKVRDEKDIDKVFEFFRYTTGTTLDCMLETGILRSSITYYVQDLEEMGLLKAICRKRDKNTNRMAKHYSSDPAKWNDNNNKQYSLNFVWQRLILNSRSKMR